MKAIQIQEPRKIGVIQMEAPELKPGQAIIRVKSMGICGSDVAAYRGTSPNVTYPLIIGHETAGTVYRIAEDNPQGFKVGDRVVLDPYMFCGHCYPCSKGRTNCCETLKCLGVQTDGSMCEYFSHPVSQLRRIPEGMTWEHAAIAEPLTIALHAIHTVELQAGEHFAIIGSGPIGLLAAMASREYGGIPVVLDVDDGRLETAKSCGVEHVINVARQDAAAELKKITDGRMAECVMEASGSVPAVAGSLTYAARTGRIALTGWPKGKVELDTATITRNELQIRGSRTSVGEFPEAIRLIHSGKVDVSKVLSKVVPFDEIPQAVRDLDEYPGEFIKVVGIID